MRFDFTDDQRMLAEAVKEVLVKTCPPEAVRAAKTDPSVRRGAPWRALAQLGLLGAQLPQEYGGLGLTPLDTVLAYEELGRAAVPGPIVETAVVAPLIVPAEWLPRIASGAAAVSVRTDDAPYLLDADAADLLVIQSGQGVTVAVPDAVELTEQPSVDPTRRLYSAAGGGQIQDRQAGCSRLDRAFDRAALATAAQLLGLGRHLLAAAVTYAGQRRQYGRQIGSFQAIKHRLADVAIGLEFAAPVVYRAAYSATHAMPSASLDASAAKVSAGEAARRAARAALQVHGAIGYTDELDLHLWFARVWSLRTAWGDDRLHRARLRALLPGRPARLP